MSAFYPCSIHLEFFVLLTLDLDKFRRENSVFHILWENTVFQTLRGHFTTEKCFNSRKLYLYSRIVILVLIKIRVKSFVFKYIKQRICILDVNTNNNFQFVQTNLKIQLKFLKRTCHCIQYHISMS